MEIPETFMPDGIIGLDARNVWILGSRRSLHWDGRRFTEHDHSWMQTHAAWSSSTSAWTVGDLGFARLDDRGWSFPEVPEDYFFGFESLAIVSDDELWAFSDRAHRFVGATRTEFRTAVTERIQSWRSAWRSASGDIWLAGTGFDNGHLQRFDGVNFHRVEPPGGFGRELVGVWGTSSTNLYALGGADGPYHYDGIAFTLLTGVSANAMGGTGPTDIWATSYRGDIRHFDGLEWSLSGSFSARWRVIHAINPDDVWVAGEDSGEGRPVSAHWDGSTWTLHEVPFVRGSRPGSPVVATPGGVTAIAGDSRTGVHLVTSAGHLLVWNGSSWELEATAGVRLQALEQGPDGSLWAAGQNLSLLRKRPGM